MQMLYACPNVKTTTYGAKLNLPPMKAFRAPGLRRGDVRARVPARRARREARPRPARAAAPQPRRHDARRRPPVQRQEPDRVLPPRRAALGAPARGARALDRRRSSAASGWPRRSGSAAAARRATRGSASAPTARATVVTAMQDVGTGTKTAMALIAAEELGIPLEHVTVAARRLLARAVRDALGGLVDDAVDGPGRRARPPRTRSGRSSRSRRSATTASSASSTSRAAWSSRRRQRWPLGEVLGLLGNAQILGTGARGPNPPGMKVLTFGVQVAEVAVDVETGEVTVERIAAIHDVGRVINPLGASSQVEGGIIQGIGHTLSEERLIDPASGAILTTTLDAYKLPTIADVPEIVTRADRRARRAADEPRLEGDRRAADHPRRRRDRERDPRRDGRRRPLAADHARGDAARARARPRADEGAWSCCSRLASTSSTARRGTFIAGGTEVVPLLRDGLLAGRHARRHRGARAARDRRRRASARARRSRSSSATRRIPDALREACRLAASPAAAQHGLDRRQPAAGDALLVLAARLCRAACTAVTAATRATASTASTRSSRTTSAPLRIRPTSPPRSLALGATLRTTGASCRSPSSTAADRGRPPHDDARAGRGDPRARRAAAPTRRPI